MKASSSHCKQQRAFEPGIFATLRPETRKFASKGTNSPWTSVPWAQGADFTFCSTPIAPIHLVCAKIGAEDWLTLLKNRGKCNYFSVAENAKSVCSAEKSPTLRLCMVIMLMLQSCHFYGIRYLRNAFAYVTRKQTCVFILFTFPVVSSELLHSSEHAYKDL